MSDLAKLQEVIRLLAGEGATLSREGTVHRAGVEIETTEAQRAAVRRALDPRRQGIVVTIHPGLPGMGGPAVDDARGQGYAAGFEAGLAHGRRGGSPGWQGGRR